MEFSVQSSGRDRKIRYIESSLIVLIVAAGRGGRGLYEHPQNFTSSPYDAPHYAELLARPNSSGPIAFANEFSYNRR